MTETGMNLSFDLEGGSADELFTYTPWDAQGYVRLLGARSAGRSGITTDAGLFLRLLDKADRIDGHNAFGYDLIALARHCGADYDALAAKTLCTLVLARLLDPPGAKHQKPWNTKGYYGLDAVAQRLGYPGKTHDLKALADRHGGYDRIPLDDPEYRAYLHGDLAAQEAVREALVDRLKAEGRWEYAQREMRVAHLQNRMTLSGWRIDTELLARRVAQEEQHKQDSLKMLADRWGLALGRSVTRGRGSARHEEFEPFSNPLGTTEGIAWLEGVWKRFGLHPQRVPRTEKGRLSTKAEVLKPIRDHARCPEELRDLLDAMAVVTGTSAKYAEIQNFLVGGRVHAGIGVDQSSGRWAMVKPSLTNLGKRGGKVAQRAVFRADEGHVLLSADLDQVDMRAVAGHSQDAEYMKLFQPGMDAHSEVADRVFGRHDGEWRSRAKVIGHGHNYGMSVNGQVRNGVDRELAERFDREMRRAFPRLCAWREEVRAEGASGRLLDNGFGRKMRCDPERAHTQAPALMGQGGARDIMTESMLRLVDAVPEAVRWFRGIVHDEMILNVPVQDAEEVGREVVKAMTWEWRGVPISAGVSKPGASWDLCYEKD